MTILRIVGALCAVLMACGEVDATPSEAPSSTDTRTTPPELAQLQQALGEASCGSTTADAVLDHPATTTNVVSSRNASYDHPTCRNAFIVDVLAQKAGGKITAGSHTESDNGWGAIACWFTWSYVGLWRKEGASYVKVTEGDAWGWQVQGRVPASYRCNAHLDLNVPQDGDYKVVVGSAVGTSTMLPVDVNVPYQAPAP